MRRENHLSSATNMSKGVRCARQRVWGDSFGREISMIKACWQRDARCTVTAEACGVGISHIWQEAPAGALFVDVVWPGWGRNQLRSLPATGLRTSTFHIHFFLFCTRINLPVVCPSVLGVYLRASDIASRIVPIMARRSSGSESVL